MAGSLLTQALAVILISHAAPAAGAPPLRYGDHLLEAALKRHPEAMRIVVSARARDGARIDLAAGPAAGAGCLVSLELDDAMRTPIGTIDVTLRPHRKAPAAAAVARYVSRRIFAADNLREPDPYVAGAPPAPLARRLVERTVDSADDLVTLAFHVRPPGSDTNRIVASNFGRIGKAADADDLRVERGETLREVTNGGLRLAVSLPLTDREGRTVGALSASFLVDPGRGEQTAYRRAFELREALARQIPSLAALFRR